MILVTGATGTVGREVVAQLVERGATVRACAHHLDKAMEMQRKGVEIVPFDFDDVATIDRAMEGIDHLFLLTPPTDENQIDEAKHVIDVAKRKGVQHIVRLSVMGADSQPGIMLGRWHRAVEEYLMQSGIGYTILRPNSFMDNFITYYGGMIRDEGKIMLPFAEGRVSYIAVHDIAEVAVKALMDAGHMNMIYTLTGPRALSGMDVAEAIGGAMGRKITYIDIPIDAARKAMETMMPEWRVQVMLELAEVNRRGYAAEVTDDVQRITGHPAEDMGLWACQHAEAWAREEAA